MQSFRNIFLITVLTLLLKLGIGDVRAASPLTGGIAHIGKDQEYGAQLAVEEIDCSGLVIDEQKKQKENVGGNQKRWTYDHRSLQRAELAGPHANRRITYL